MVVGFTTTYAMSAYHHWCCEFESQSGRGVQHYVIKFVSDLRQIGGFLYTTLCDKVCQWLAAGRWFSPGSPFSPTNKTYCHNLTEIMLIVALNTINSAAKWRWPYFAIYTKWTNKIMLLYVHIDFGCVWTLIFIFFLYHQEVYIQMYNMPIWK
jgi:hypothetical protein